MTKRYGNIRRPIEEARRLGSPQFLAGVCNRAENSRDQCLIALTFLSGRRIGELLEVKRKDVQVYEDEISLVTFNEKNYRRKEIGVYKLARGDRFYEQIRPTFPTIGPTGSLLSPYVLKHLEGLEPLDYVLHDLRSKRRHIHRRMALRIIVTLEPSIWLHWLRHARFTQVAQVYRDDLMSFHDFTFHKRIENSLGYVSRARTQERLREI